MAPTRSGGNKVAKGRGRPPGKRNSITKANRGPMSVTSKAKAGRKRTSQTKQDTQGSSTAKKRGRPSGGREQQTDDGPDEIAAEQPKTQKYVQLAPRTRRIAQEKIDTWPQVSPQVLDRIIGVLKDATKDIVNTQRDERRAVVADETLSALVRVLGRQLSASRIPPQAKDIHFNIDKLTERYAQLFREVTTERHSKQLLKEQVKVAQHILKKDEESLEQLKKNAKEWKAEWKHQQKRGRIHPLLQDLEDMEVEGDAPDDIGLKPSRATGVSIVDDPDSELEPLLDQLRRSLENMQGNHEQLAGLDEAMRNANAALDDVLFRHAGAQQYAAL